MSFEQLLSEHDQIDALTEELDGICAGDAPDVYRVVETRFALKASLDHHLGHEDANLYARIMGAAGSSRDAIDHFQIALRHLCADWKDYLTEWTPDSIAADWAAFQAETTDMMARVRARTSEESRLIYTMALRQGVIPLRAKAA